MNPIAKAIDEIMWDIPLEILTQVFITQDMVACGAALSLETRIRETIIDNRVVVDLDLFGTNEDYISLDAPCRSEYIDPYTVVYYVPEEVTQGRPIRQLYSLHFGILGYQNAGQALRYSESPLGSEVRKVLDSAMRIPPALTSYLNLINHNTFMVRFVTLPYPSAFLRCRLGADSEMNFLRPTSIPMFAELCVHAAKAYIYNRMRIPMDQAFLSGGQQLGAFRDTIMEWAGENAEYKEKMKRMRKLITAFNDPEARRRHIRTVVPPS